MWVMLSGVYLPGRNCTCTITKLSGTYKTQSYKFLRVVFRYKPD
jgi:hypothetical protein